MDDRLRAAIREYRRDQTADNAIRVASLVCRQAPAPLNNRDYITHPPDPGYMEQIVAVYRRSHKPPPVAKLLDPNDNQLTYRELLSELLNLSDEQLDCKVAIVSNQLDRGDVIAATSFFVKSPQNVEMIVRSGNDELATAESLTFSHPLIAADFCHECGKALDQLNSWANCDGSMHPHENTCVSCITGDFEN